MVLSELATNYPMYNTEIGCNSIAMGWFLLAFGFFYRIYHKPMLTEEKSLATIFRPRPQ
jgi:hypothetical protein